MSTCVREDLMKCVVVVMCLQRLTFKECCGCIDIDSKHLTLVSQPHRHLKFESDHNSRSSIVKGGMYIYHSFQKCTTFDPSHKIHFCCSNLDLMYGDPLSCIFTLKSCLFTQNAVFGSRS